MSAAEFINSELNKSGVIPFFDGMGNIIVKSEICGKQPHILIGAHMDEPCFIITQICERGYLKFEAIGDIPPYSVLSKRVACGKTKGVISAKAIHLLSKEEREKSVQIDDLFIDIGAENADTAKKIVSPGDYFVFDTDYVKLGNNSVSYSGLSDKVSYLVLIETIKYFKQRTGIAFDAVFTVQKHLFNRGMKCALKSAFRNTPIDLSIIIDCVDLQKLNKKINALSDETVYLSVDQTTFERIPEISDRIQGLAEKLNIKLELLISDEKSDADAFSIQNYDIPTITLMVGCLNKNTGYPIVNISGVKKSVDLVIKITEDIIKNGVK